MTTEQEESLSWAESCIQGKKIGASTRHLKNLVDLIFEQFEEIEHLHGQKIER